MPIPILTCRLVDVASVLEAPPPLWVNTLHVQTVEVDTIGVPTVAGGDGEAYRAVIRLDGAKNYLYGPRREARAAAEADANAAARLLHG